MTNVLLIRHAAHDYLGRGIPGRRPGVALNELGRQQAQQLARRLSKLPIDAIYSSPMERARQTAEPLAHQLQLAIRTADEFNELEMGEWTDRMFADLEGTAKWRAFNLFRSCVAAPGGELMSDAQARVTGKIFELREQHQFVAIFSHGDPIRAALAYFLGMHLDMYARLEIDPAATSLVEVGDDWARVRLLNLPPEETPLELPWVR